ncbi:uncharacterized protein N7477_001293, partial [Penicillium maclennaniae]|uniref:uncharacterized protein n=1 Tax=Penicillium maclennaniae TaxID=1343394 RepID=UPI0025401BF2
RSYITFFSLVWHISISFTLETPTMNRLSQISLQEGLLYGLLGLAAYLILASSLRFQRRRILHNNFPYRNRASMGKMTDHDAFAIQKTIMEMEYPFIVLKSIHFALFRVRISHSERAQTAIARTKFLHKGYRDSGKILEDDMLYTLSLFATEPIRFVKLYEWREMTEMERCAVGTYWKSLGDALSISYEKLPSSKTEFQDGIHWLEEISEWSHSYELQHMKPHPRNKEVADKTIDVLVYNLPEFMKPLGIYLVSFLMDERLRNAMMMESPPAFFRITFVLIFQLRRAFLRYLALPRPSFIRLDVFTEKPNEHGRNYVTYYEGAPFYVQPTIWNRWGPVAWFKWAMEHPLPGDDGDKYYPQGYYSPDLGPKYFEGKGRKVGGDQGQSSTAKTGTVPIPVICWSLPRIFTKF